MKLEHLGLIGNCRYGALIHRDGSVVWCCLPRFDSEPVFSTLIDEMRGGFFSIRPPDGQWGVQRYVENTNVLETRFDCDSGSFRVLDFAPRYIVGDRIVRPPMLIRVVEPVKGRPQARISCQPRLGWSATVPQWTAAPGEISFSGFSEPLRLGMFPATPSPDEGLAAISRKRYYVLALGDALPQDLPAYCEHMLTATIEYWRRWVTHASVPLLFQNAVIRSALALKLHCYEDTGAIVASMTTSIPEAPGSGRTWDYRYCWLRDAYFVISAFRLLGHFEERQQFIQFLLRVLGEEEGLFAPHIPVKLAPVYRIDGSLNLDERILPEWNGFDGEKPVRTGNAAALQTQNDVYGEMVLALAPVFLDERYVHERTPELLEVLIHLTRKAIVLAGTPDAGIWEFRDISRPQTFSSLMAWAAADRMARVASRQGLNGRNEFSIAAERLRQDLLANAWNASLGSLVSTYGGDSLDASLLQAVTLRFLPPSDPRMRQMVDAISKELNRGGWLLRYSANDGFGVPTTSFMICTFWLIEALCVLGETDRARIMMNTICGNLPPLGLLAEDRDSATGIMWGNFPQTYSHVGMIRAAFAASPHWTEWL